MTAKALQDQSIFPFPHAYKLVSLQLKPSGGKYIWHAVYRSISEFPEDPSEMPVVLGGEIFVGVDLETEETHVTYGE